MRMAPRFARVEKTLVRAALCFCAANLLAAILLAQCSNPTQVPNGTYTSGDHSHVDNNALSASNFVLSGSATATFVAGNCIQLLPGFHATAGTVATTFHAWVETAPTAVSGSPSSGSGSTQQFTWTASSPSGYGNLSDVYALFSNSSQSGQNACYIRYNQASSLLYVADNSGANWQTGLAPGNSGTSSNSQCTIYGSGSSVSGSGTQLTLTVSVTFQPSYAGTQNNYLIAYDNAGLSSEWQQMGTWTVPQPPPPTYTISGHVTSNGTALSGVTITLTGSQSGSATTDANGNYSFTVNGGGSYTVTPSKSGYTFNPSYASFSNLGSNQTANFAATPPPPPSLTITSAHTGDFTQGDTGDFYTLTVTNTGSGSTNGTTVAVAESLPSGLFPTGIAGTNWTCTQPAGPCTRSDVLAPSASYPAITVTVNVSSNAPATVTNQASVAGGGSAGANASDPTTIDALLRYVNPLAFATSASVVAGVPTNFTVTYTSENGPSDIASGQIKIGDNCYLEWDSSGNVLLHGYVNGYPDYGGTMGQPYALWTGDCSINLANSSVAAVPGNPKALAVTLNITFPEQRYVSEAPGRMPGDSAKPTLGERAPKD